MTGDVVPVVSPEDPRTPDVAALLDTHLAFALANTPPEHVCALDADARLVEGLDYFGVRDGDDLVAVGGILWLDPAHVELKSIHVAAAARGRGLGRVVVEHLLATAAAKGATRASLDTGTTPGFAASRALYESMGFTPCAPFATHVETSSNVYMTRRLP